MEKIIIGVAAHLVFGALNLAAQGEQLFKGLVCLGPEGRAPVTMNGQTGLPCTIAHPKRGAKYVLLNFENNTLYQLDDRSKAKDFAGVNVFVSGTLNEAAGTIHITDILPDSPPKIMRAKSIYQELALQTDGFRIATALREHLPPKFSSNTDIAKGALCPKKSIRSIRSYTVP